MTRPARGQQGAAAVEFALVCPLLFVLMFGMIQYGVYFWSLQSGADAARTAAREAAVGSLDCAAFESLVQHSARGVESDFAVTRTYYAAGDTELTSSITTPIVGDIVKVSVSYNSIDFGFPAIPFIDAGRIHEVAVSRVETATPMSVACS